METQLRAALLDWLGTDPDLSGRINLVAEESPVRASPPWLGIAASASADWSVKDRKGREIRIAVELQCRGDDPGLAGALTGAVERRIEALPRAQKGLEIVTCTFLRGRAAQRPRNLRAVLLEYRFRVLAS